MKNLWKKFRKFVLTMKSIQINDSTRYLNLWGIMEQLKKSEKKALMEKITPIVGDIILSEIKKRGWTRTEISVETGVHLSRITEYTRYRTGKYKNPISESDLVLFLGGDILKITDLIKKADINKNEKSYLLTLQIYEDKKMGFLYQKIKAMGADPASILEDYIKNNS